MKRKRRKERTYMEFIRKLQISKDDHDAMNARRKNNVYSR